MRLTPRYGTDPVIVATGDPAAVATPAIRQRQRLGAALTALDDDQWTHASRCAGWSTRDVVAHLDTVNRFWTYSIDSGRRGSPTQLLASFDPVASPAEMAAADDREPSAVLDAFLASNDALIACLASMDGDDWTMPAEAPPGHLAITAVAHHGLWDAWVHERDILEPLGVPCTEAADEIVACLAYVAALGPAFAICQERAGAGRLVLETTDPEVRLVVDIGSHVEVGLGTGHADLVLRGDAVALLEALSLRRPLAQPIPDAHAWMLDGLAVTFDAPPA